VSTRPIARAANYKDLMGQASIPFACDSAN